MKIWRWGYLGIAIAITCCSPGTTAQQTALSKDSRSGPETLAPEATACSPMDTQVPLQPSVDMELPFERFDFRTTDVETTESTLTFKGKRYGFRFCKGDRTWGVQTINPQVPPEDEDAYIDYFDSLIDPDYTAVTNQDRDYQARVRLDAAWLNDPSIPNDLEQVIFELIKPGDSQPISSVLYTNTDIIERELGASAGVPTITQTLATADAIWWSIGFEQGEGASGITTLVQYEMDTEQIIVWQLSELGHTQITDLALTTTDDEPILWLGTQYSGEGNPYLPAKGLVAYRPTDQTVETYTVENSPLIGAIPTKLWADDDKLWAATANGICEIDWATIDSQDSWACWRFTTMAEVPANQDVYASLLADTPIQQLQAADRLELLWVADTDMTTPDASVRYEIAYESGIVTQLNQGADYYVGPQDDPDDGYFWWPGRDWSWNGQRFVRPWDQVAVNYVGGGPQGMGPDEYNNFVVDWQTMRGEFDLLALTPETTEIKYYSAWIDAEGIEPWVTVTSVPQSSLDATDPTTRVLQELKQAAR